MCSPATWKLEVARPKRSSTEAGASPARAAVRDTSMLGGRPDGRLAGSSPFNNGSRTRKVPSPSSEFKRSSRPTPCAASRKSPEARPANRPASEAVDAAKKSGSWDAAYDSPKSAEVPEDFQTALDASPRAREFFRALDGANRYAVLFRIQTVKKAETRARKIREFVKMLERNEKLHQPRKARPHSQ